MYRVLMIECACEGLLTVNGQFCGPLEKDGQAFPMGRNAQAYIHFTAYDPRVGTLAAAIEMRDDRLVRLEPQDRCFALVWPDGVVQLELCPEHRDAQRDARGEDAAACTLLRYLSMNLSGDMQAQRLLMRPQDGISLDGYEAAVPLRFSPAAVSPRFDERAGLVRRIFPNAAVVDAALACTVPTGQGHRMIERIEILRT